MGARGSDRQPAAHADPDLRTRAVTIGDNPQLIGRRRRILLLGLFVVVGANLRTVLLAVPPVLAFIQRDLSLTHTGVGLLTALPVLMMGVGAWPAGLLMNRIGGRRVVAIGLLMIAAGAALRGLWPAAFLLYAFTVLLSVGIAVAQTSVVALVRHWFPGHIGLASALYTDGIISGEALGAGLTLPLMAGWLGPDAWRTALALWAVPVLLVLLLWLLMAPGGLDRQSATQRMQVRGGSRVLMRSRIAGRPFWLLALHCGLLSGSCSLIYFSMNAWTAPYNAALGQSSVTPLSLALLNASQLPVCLTITLVAQRLTGRRLPFAISGLLCLTAMAGWALTASAWQPLWAAVFGGSSVAVLVLGLALPPFFATRSSVAQLVGATLTVSYLLSFIGQLAGGRLWDLSGRPIFAFLPVVAASLALIVLAALLPDPGRAAAARGPLSPAIPVQA